MTWKSAIDDMPIVLLGNEVIEDIQGDYAWISVWKCHNKIRRKFKSKKKRIVKKFQKKYIERTRVFEKYYRD